MPTARAVVFVGRFEEDDMHMRSKAFVRIISRLLGIRASALSNGGASQEASPLLIFTATVLALLLAVLVADLHRAELDSLGLLDGAFLVDDIFKSP
jgi:hypothetical protein